MSKPVAGYPTTVWNGLSANPARRTIQDDVHPDFRDWDRIVAELIATQTYASGDAVSAVAAAITDAGIPAAVGAAVTAAGIPALAAAALAPGLTVAPAPVAGVVTLNLTTHTQYKAVLAADTTLAVSGAQVGENFRVVIAQDDAGSHALTFFTGVLWAGGVPPTPTQTASGIDVFDFFVLSAGVYLGSVYGQAFA